MPTLFGCIALGCLLSATSYSAQEMEQSQKLTTSPEKARRPGKFVLRRSADSDVDLSDAVLTIGPDGRGTVKLGGTMNPGHAMRTFVIVDVERVTFHAFSLDQPGRDAKRLHEFYRTRGVRSSEEGIRDYLTKSKRRAEEEVAARRRKLDQQDPNASGPNGCDLASDVPCEGEGYVRVDTWEPAKYWFPVTHLTQTVTAATWLRNIFSGLIYAGRSGSCWANPFSFVATYWVELACIPSLTNYGTSFDATTIGSYLNWNFLFDEDAVTVTASASVQHTYGIPIWGYSHEVKRLGTTTKTSFCLPT